jgi:hypothetical protein
VGLLAEEAACDDGVRLPNATEPRGVGAVGVLALDVENGEACVTRAERSGSRVGPGRCCPEEERCGGGVRAAAEWLWLCARCERQMRISELKSCESEREGQRACPHAQLGIPETAHGPTLEYHQLCLTVAPLTHLRDEGVRLLERLHRRHRRTAAAHRRRLVPQQRQHARREVVPAEVPSHGGGLHHAAAPHGRHRGAVVPAVHHHAGRRARGEQREQRRRRESQRGRAQRLEHDLSARPKRKHLASVREHERLGGSALWCGAV